MEGSFELPQTLNDLGKSNNIPFEQLSLQFRKTSWQYILK